MQFLKSFCSGIILFLICSFSMFSQENPPVPVQVEVRTSRFLNFGSFTTNGGVGTVHVDYTSHRTATGDVVLLNFGASPSAALFDVTVNPGTIITMQHLPQIQLTGSNGGELLLQIDSYSTGTPVFISTEPTNLVNEIYIGGTLLLGTTNTPPGKYSGTVVIDFIQQ